MRARTSPAGNPASLIVLVAGTAISLSTAANGQVAGESVVRGQVQFSRAPGVTTITASNGAIINYQSFNIPQGQAVRFVQPDASSRVLNRITSGTPTRIDGTLTANGRVYITNPAGVLFGASSVINAAGFFAAAGNLSNADFAAGIDHFTNVTGPVVNQGAVTSPAVALIGNRVENHGKIVADGGMVTMLSGNDVLIREGNGQIYARIDGRDLNSARPSSPGAGVALGTAQGVTNTGSISAKGGIITLGAGDAVSLAIRNSGRIDAAGGRITADAGIGILRNDGVMTASVEAGQAGSVVARGAAVINNGQIAADAGSGRAGSVELTSSRLTYLGRGSIVSAKGGLGAADGGHVLVHSYQGNTYVASGATVDLSGGLAGGNGGVGEVSAGNSLGLYGTIRGDAAPGHTPATILFDPLNVAIRTPGPNDGELSDGQILAGDGGAASFTVSPAAIQNFAGDVRLEATQDIQVFESINKANGGLTLQAGRDIVLSGPTGTSVPNIDITASFLDFRAGRNIRDLSPNGTELTATVGDISTLATTGSVAFGLATVPADHTVSITQAISKFVGAGPFGFIGSPTTTHVVVNITNGYLVLGGEFGGTSGYQKVLSIDGQATQYVRVEDNLDILSFINLRSTGNVEVNGFIHSKGSIDLHSGLDGSGDVKFLACSTDLWGQSIALRAGSNTGLATARVDAQTGDPMFRGPDGGKSRPGTFIFEEDAAVADSHRPLASQFGAPLAGMNYRIESYDATVTLGSASSVAGTALTLASQTGSTINSALSLASLDVFGSALLNANIASTAHQTYNGPVKLGGDRALSGTTVTFNSTVDGTTTGAQSLALSSNLVSQGAIGGSTALEALSVTGTSAINGGIVTTNGAQAYAGAVTFGADATLTGTTIGLGSTANGTISGEQSLKVAGGLTAGGTVGTLHALESLSVTGPSAINGGSVATTGAQTFGGDVSLGADTTLSASAVRFDAAVNGVSAGQQALNVAANLVANGAIGNTAALESFSITGGAELNGGSVATTGIQSYGGTLRLGADTTLSASVVRIDGEVDGLVAGQQSMVVAGDLILGSAVGSGAALESLDVSGATQIDGGSVTTTGPQRYAGAVTLGNDSLLTGSSVAFGDTVDGPHRLRIAGDMAASDKIGSSIPLRTLMVSGGSTLNGGAVTTTGAQSYSGPVALGTDTILTGQLINFGGPVDGDADLAIVGSMATGGPVGASTALQSLTVSGASAIDGGAIVTTGTQVYGGPVTLGNDAALTGSAVSFNGTVDGSRSLLVDGDLTAADRIGSLTPLSALTVTGASALNGGSAATTGVQSYSGPVALGVDTDLTASDVAFGGAVDGGVTLSVVGNLAAGAPIGASSPLQSLSITGTSALDGGSVATSGHQVYGNAVTLGADTTLSASMVRFEGAVDGAFGPHPALLALRASGESLTVNGDLTLDGALGADVPLDFVHVTGFSTINGGIVTTSGGQTYDGAVRIGADTTMTATSVLFGSTADSAGAVGRALTVAGDLVAQGGIGASQALSSLHVTGDTGLNGRFVVSSGEQRYDGAVSLGDDTFLTASRVLFGGTVDGIQAGAQSLIVFGDMETGGALGGQAALEYLTVNGATTIGGSSITTASSQTYNGAVVLLDDAALVSLAGGRMFFGGTVDGTHDLSVTTTPEGLIIFTDNVGATESLGILRLSTAGASSSRDIPQVATIVGDRTRAVGAFESADADIRFVVTDFIMGQNEKFTTLGGLSLAASREAVLGDLTTVGNMTVKAPTITLQRRGASNLLNSSGAFVGDRGVDFVSGGEITFEGSVFLAGVGLPPPTFGARTFTISRGPLAGYEITLSNPADTTRAALVFNGVVLDQRTQAALKPPTSSQVAAVTETNRIRFSDSVQPKAYDLRMFGRLSINARGASDEEIDDALIGRLVYDDLPSGIETYDSEDRKFAAGRTDIDSVARVVNGYNAAFGTPDADQTRAIATALSESANRYFTLSGAAQFDARKFRQYLETDAQEQRTLAYVQQLHGVLSDMNTLGLPPGESRQSQARLLTKVTPTERMTVGQLIELLETPPTPPRSGS